MAGIVGGVGCDIMRGEAPAKKERLRLWQVPGIDGYGAHADGLGDSAFVFVATKYGLRAAVETWSAAIEAPSERPNRMMCSAGIPRCSTR